MNFFKVLDNLKEKYGNNVCVRENGTILLGPGNIPRSEHMLYAPLTDDLIEEFLVSQYKYTFPKDYIEFLKYSNGADLCIVRMIHNVKKKKIPTASVLFTILGLPRTPPFSRPANMEEPFDLRIEDLARHPELPSYWLKCGCYKRNYDFRNLYDIFIDTKSNNVYSCIKNEKEIVDSWDNLDECFCSIFSSFENREKEYEFK